MADNELVSTKKYPGLGRFHLGYEDDGVYLLIDAGDTQLDIMTIISYIKRKEIQDADMGLASRVLSVGNACREKIAPAQREIVLEENIHVDIENGNLEAYVTMEAPDEGGRMYTKERLLHELALYHKIENGVMEEAVERFVDDRNYDERILMAQGAPAQNGVHAVLTYHFETDTDKIGKIVDESAKVDHHEVKAYQKVAKGQVLISRSMPTVGEPGMDVFGKIINPRPGKDVPFPAGKNMEMSEDKRSLLASLDGRIDVDKVTGKIVVSPSVLVDGDIDLKSGNIDFEGDVEVKGNVIAGFKIKAGGNVTVHGLVEAAEIESGGDIVIHNGISGGDKGVLKAGGRIFVRYVERATLEAGTNINTEFALHSTMLCKGHINALYGKGSIIGGKASAGKYIVAGTLGADASTPTSIEIGIDPAKQRRMAEIDELVEGHEDNIKKVKLQLKKGDTPVFKLPEDKLKQLKALLGALEGEKEKLRAEYDSISEEVQKVVDGEIYVKNKIYPNVRLAIGKSVYTVRREDQHITYYRDKADIVTKPYSFVESREKD